MRKWNKKSKDGLNTMSIAKHKNLFAKVIAFFCLPKAVIWLWNPQVIAKLVCSIKIYRFYLLWRKDLKARAAYFWFDLNFKNSQLI